MKLSASRITLLEQVAPAVSYLRQFMKELCPIPYRIDGEESCPLIAMTDQRVDNFVISCDGGIFISFNDGIKSVLILHSRIVMVVCIHH